MAFDDHTVKQRPGREEAGRGHDERLHGCEQELGEPEARRSQEQEPEARPRDRRGEQRAGEGARAEARAEDPEDLGPGVERLAREHRAAAR